MLWQTHTGSTISSPSVSNGYVYIGSYDGYVCCLNASSGAKVWKYQTPDSVISSPAVAYGCVYIGSEDNNVYCLNASSGSKVWRSPTGYWVTSSPAVAGRQRLRGLRRRQHLLPQRSHRSQRMDLPNRKLRRIFPSHSKQYPLRWLRRLPPLRPILNQFKRSNPAHAIHQLIEIGNDCP